MVGPAKNRVGTSNLVRELGGGGSPLEASYLAGAQWGIRNGMTPRKAIHVHQANMMNTTFVFASKLGSGLNIDQAVKGANQVFIFQIYINKYIYIYISRSSSIDLFFGSRDVKLHRQLSESGSGEDSHFLVAMGFREPDNLLSQETGPEVFGFWFSCFFLGGEKPREQRCGGGLAASS